VDIDKIDKEKSLQKHKRLSGLYRQDPGEFEKVTNQMVEDLIRDSPPEYQLRLRLLQAKWDKRMKGGNTPHNRLTLAKDMFFEHFYNVFQPSLKLK